MIFYFYQFFFYFFQYFYYYKFFLGLIINMLFSNNDLSLFKFIDKSFLNFEYNSFYYYISVNLKSLYLTNTWLIFINYYIYIFSFFCLFFFVRRILKFFYHFFYNIIKMYKYYRYSDYNLLYQIWYKYARNQKNTYLATRFRLVYLNKKYIQKEILNDRIYNEEIQEYFILKRKNFFDSYLKPTKIRKFVPLVDLRRKFYSIQRRKNSLKGILFFYFKDYENRINNKEEQQRTLRIYEGLYGTFIYKELLKKEDQKQAKYVSMKLHRN